MSARDPKFEVSPLGLALKIGIIVLGGEFAIMLAIDGFFTPMFGTTFADSFWEFLDPFLLSLIVSPTLYFLVLRPMREQQALLEKQKDELSIAAVTFNSQEGVIVTDANHTILRVNSSFSTITGYSSEEVIGKTPALLQSGRQGPEFYREMRNSLENRQFWQGEIWNRRKNGVIFPEWLTITAVTGERGKIYYVGIFSDITKRKAYEERINFMAYHDRLTELPSRELFYDRLALAMSKVRRKEDYLALFFLDLDGFKELNDTYGHEAGDEVLKTIAARLLSCVRSQDTVSRLGGDEFAIVLNGVEVDADASHIAGKVIEALSRPIQLRSGVSCTIGASIGIAIYPKNGVEIDTLMSAADHAMYASKLSGKNRFTFSTEEAAWGMPVANWVVLDDSSLVGIPELDRSHQELARILNDLNSSVALKQPREEIEQLTERLAAEIHEHFAHESELIMAFDYPGGTLHNQEHQRLEAELELLISKFYSGSEMAVLHELKEWLLDHISSFDVPLSKFILDARGRNTENNGAGQGSADA